MYSKQEASRLKDEFWTAFGMYMGPVLSAEGEKLNWVNYKTGEKNIAFRLQADNKKASVAIELTHKDPGIQQLYFDQFMQLKNLLRMSLQEDWTWTLHVHDDHGRIVSRIYTQKVGLSIFKKEDWPELISFF